eukprot:CAMPEP_0168737004 /NCGR_PEP_ID=MMETSP0724-20121128/10158_1 /TAXON_ID=265536 /ORGANISM="Amphiprora sp., Strain CCMP467" /LENGTH=730 /DNA_ID=CAMNT_0008784231 /DNA_START=209 /DNA_END=2401 /DNA_ORIENTATION=-
MTKNPAGSQKEDVEVRLPSDELPTHSVESGDTQGDEAQHKEEEKPKNHHERDPFWAFIPQVGRYAGNLVGHELAAGAKAITVFPSFSKEYIEGTWNFYRTNPKILYNEVISGFTVAIMQVPESIAFSFVAGVPPLSGLHATFWMATITGLMGGKPGMISGAAGALAVVVADLTVDDGVLDYLAVDQRLNVLFMTMVVCGAFQILFAWFRLAKLIRLIPETGLIGFMDGLAIIIFMAQLPAFMKCTTQPLFVDCSVEDRQWLTFSEDTSQLIATLFHVAICMAIMKFYPKVPYVGRMVPSSLVALLVGTFVEHVIFRKLLHIETRTVEETAEMSGDLPKFDWPQIPTDSDTVNTVLIYAVTLAAIGGVESVLTLQACNEITDTVPKISDSNQELFAQGAANLVCGIFRAMGGDAMIGQSTINIMNGARYRVSSTMSGVFMLLFVVGLSGFIELLPIATLTGVLFMVVLSTFQWKTFLILRYGRLSDGATIIIVTLMAVFLNLAVGIAAGIVFSALVHAWDSANHVDADIVLRPDMIINGELYPLVKFVHVKGAIFFSSCSNFINLFNVKEDPPVIVIDFKDALIIDHSAVAAIQGITHRFDKVGKRVLLINLPQKSHGRLHRTGDHDVLSQQITNPDEIQESGRPFSTEGDDVPSTFLGGGATLPTTTQDVGQDDERFPILHVPVVTGDETNFGAELAHLPLFDAQVDRVDDELSSIARDQGDLSIHEKRS